MKALICAFLISFVFSKDQGLEKTTLKFSNGKSIKVEVAQSFSDRSRGLMHRTELAENSGMLFVFGAPQKLSFWMKNTYIPLSIAYIDQKKVIKEIHQMKAQSLMEREQTVESYPSQCRCQYALEVNQGWFKKHKVKVGDTIQFNIPTAK